MHFVREKRDKPPRLALSFGKRLSDKREKTYSSGYSSLSVSVSAVSVLGGRPEGRASKMRRQDEAPSLYEMRKID
jgi:hypothetical protein